MPTLTTIAMTKRMAGEVRTFLIQSAWGVITLQAMSDQNWKAYGPVMRLRTIATSYWLLPYQAMKISIR